MLNMIVESADGVTIFNQTVSNGAVIGFLLFIAAFYVTFYVLRSIGIYKLAKNQGIEKAYIAFIPCVWMFTACKIIGKARIFGNTAEKLAVWFAVIFTAATVIPLVYDCFTIVPYALRYLQGNDITITLKNGNLELDPRLVYSNGVIVFLNILSVFNYLLRIAEIFITVTVYIALFRKFWPEHYILASVLSFFGLFPIFVFAIRNRKAVDFNEYLRRRFYGSGYTPYGPYGGYRGQGGANNSYGAPQGGGFSDGKDEPFDEFSNRPDEPFGEFDGGAKNRGDNDNDNGSGNNGDDYYQ